MEINNNNKITRVVKAVSYLRVSTEDQAGDDKVSISHQAAECERAAASRGWLLVNQYVEPGVTGESLTERVALQAMLTDARLPSKPFDAVIVYHSDRLARRPDIAAVLFQLLENELRIPIVALNIALPVDPLNFDPFKDDTRLIANTVGNLLASLDQRTRVRRMQGAKKAYVQAGKWIGTIAPYGYQKLYEVSAEQNGTTTRRLEPDPNEYPALEFVFNRFLEGDTPIVITRKLEARRKAGETGYSTRKGGPWSRRTVDAILRNPFYAGLLRYGQRTVHKSPTSGKKSLKRNQSQQDIVWGTHGFLPVPITPEQYQEVLHLFDERRVLIKEEGTSPRSFASRNPLSRLIFCGWCGGAMFLYSGTKTKQLKRTGEIVRYPTAIYKCIKSFSQGERCPSPVPPAINARKALQAVFDQVVSFARNHASGQQVLFNSSLEASNNNAADPLKELDRRETLLATKISNLDDGFLSGVVTKEKYKELSQRLETEKENLAREREQITARLRDTAKREAEQREMFTLLEAFEERIRECYSIEHEPERMGELKPYNLWTQELAQDINKLLRGILARVEFLGDRDNSTGARTYEIKVFLREF